MKLRFQRKIAYKTLLGMAFRRLKEDSPVTFLRRALRFLILTVDWLYVEVFMLAVPLKLKCQGQSANVKKQILGSEMYLDVKGDEGISRDLFVYGIREPFNVKAMQKEIKPGDIVVDIGANIGYYALLEARLVGKKGKVYAIEPVPKNIELLTKNIELNNYSNIEVFQMAIGSENKKDFIHISKLRNICSMAQQEIYRSTYTHKVPVQVITLDDFLKDKAYPDLVRMDVEGYEFEIIKGMKETLKVNNPLKLFVELHLDLLKDKAKSFLKTLKGFGFEVKMVSNEPVPSLQKSKLRWKITNILGKKIDAEYGYLNMNMDELLKSELVRKSEGRLEVLFERKGEKIF